MKSLLPGHRCQTLFSWFRLQDRPYHCMIRYIEIVFRHMSVVQRGEGSKRSTAPRDELMVSVRIVPATTGGPARPKSVEINSHHCRNDHGEHNYDYGGNKNQKHTEKDKEHRSHGHAE